MCVCGGSIFLSLYRVRATGADRSSENSLEGIRFRRLADKWGGAYFLLSLSRSARREIRVQKEGPVNSQRLVREFRTSMGKSRPIRRECGRPFFRALIAAKGAAISAHFSRPEIGRRMDPEIGYPHPRLESRQSEQLAPNGRAAISGRSWGYRGQSAADPNGPLSGP